MRAFFKDRFTIIGIIFILIFAVIIYQLAYIQLVQGQNYLAQSQTINLRSRTLLAERGKILDRYGVPIATSSTSYYLMLMDTGCKSDQLNDMIYKIIKILEKNGDEYNKSFSKYITDTKTFGSSLIKNKNKIGALKATTGYDFSKLSDLSNDSTAQEIYNYLKDKVFKIDSKYKDADVYKIMTVRFEIMGYNSLNPIIAKSISINSIAEIEERIDEFPGAVVDVMPSRKYIDAQYAAHLIGYVRGISEDELAKHEGEGYLPNDIIGKTGIEATAEGYLRGTNGVKRVEVDDNGKTKIISEESVKPGSYVYLTIDMKLQKAAMDSLAKNIKVIRDKDVKGNYHDAFAGAVVAMDVNTGEVLALASYPSYNPSIYLAGPEDKAAQKAITALISGKDETTSEFNRAIAGKYEPGSTYKPLVGLAALQENAIGPSYSMVDKGFMIIDGMELSSIEWRTGRYGLGRVDLVTAIQKSCNTFFYDVGIKTGIDNIAKWAKKFGLGQKTGIDIKGEDPGILSSREYKKTITRDFWGRADTAQSSIGQLYNNFTPIQLVNYVSTIANGGKHFKPHVIKKVVKYDGSTVTETKPEYEVLPVTQSNISLIQKGMMAVAKEDGTAAKAFDGLAPIKVAAKTGTAEKAEKDHSSNAVFICYAPADKPQIAVAVVVERGVYGAYTAPIAYDVLAQYFDINSSSKANTSAQVNVPVFTR